MAAAAAAHLAGAPLEGIAAAIRTFQAVEHRLEFVSRVRGVDYYNDSKATNVDSTLKAIEAFDGPLWVILGGKDKGSDYSALAPPLAAKARAALLIGAATPQIAAALGQRALLECGTLENAIETVFERPRRATRWCWRPPARASTSSTTSSTGGAFSSSLWGSWRRCEGGHGSASKERRDSVRDHPGPGGGRPAHAGERLLRGGRSRTVRAGYFAVRQLVWALVAVAVMMFLKKRDYRKFNTPPWAYGAMAVILLLLMLVYFLDPRLHRWFRIGPISIQPSEFAKPVLVLFLAHFAARRAAAINNRRTLICAAVIVGLVAGIVMVADLGTAVVIAASAAMVFLVAGLEWRFAAVAGAILLVFVSIAILTKPYRIARIFGYFDPEYKTLDTALVRHFDPEGRAESLAPQAAPTGDSNYHINQSLIAVGSGGPVGVGPCAAGRSCSTCRRRTPTSSTRSSPRNWACGAPACSPGAF